MEIITSIEAMRAFSCSRRERHRLALVPTLGNIHLAHLALVKRAARLADKVVVSIFLNPLQFDKREDFSNYPRTTEQDCAQLASHAVDAVFIPEHDDMYPPDEDQSIRIDVGPWGEVLCGVHRPLHFQGVALVVMKLLQIVQPHTAVFGEKDYQQLCLIRRLVKRFNVPVELVSHPTVREADGLAVSSRNAYLNAEQRKEAGFLYQTLLSAKQDLQAGMAVAEIEQKALRKLSNRGWKPDYFSLRKADTLAEADVSCRSFVIVAAAYLGKARLIDNLSASLDSSS